MLVKLFMLAQLEIMEQNSFRNTPEVMDARLFRETAARHFKLIEPMMTALKTNSQRDIRKYDDLRPLESHVRQIFQNALLQSEPLPAPDPEAEADRKGLPDPLIGALVQAGLAEDIAVLMATKTRTLHPGASVLELIGHVSALLRDHGPETSKKAKRAPRKDKPRQLPVSILSDIVRKGREAGQSAEESLIAAGLVRPPRFGSA